MYIHTQCKHTHTHTTMHSHCAPTTPHMHAYTNTYTRIHIHTCGMYTHTHISVKRIIFLLCHQEPKDVGQIYWLLLHAGMWVRLVNDSMPTRTVLDQLLLNTHPREVPTDYSTPLDCCSPGGLLLPLGRRHWHPQTTHLPPHTRTHSNFTQSSISFHTHVQSILGYKQVCTNTFL